MNIVLSKEVPSINATLHAVTESYLSVDLTNYDQCNHTVLCPC